MEQNKQNQTLLSKYWLKPEADRLHEIMTVREIYRNKQVKLDNFSTESGHIYSIGLQLMNSASQVVYISN